MARRSLAELSRLLPDLRERYPDLPPPTIGGAFASSRLFEALAQPAYDERKVEHELTLALDWHSSDKRFFQRPSPLL